MAVAPRRGGAVVAATIVAAIVVALAIVVWTAPANWLALKVAERTGGVVLLADARGTVWSGSAVMALGAPDAAGVAAAPRFSLPGRITWTLGFERSLAPVLHLSHDDGLLPAPVVARLSGGGVAIDPGAAVFPASLLRLAGAPFNTLMPDGRCELRWTRVAVDRAGTAVGDGTLRIGGLALAVSPVRPLGDYRVAWSSDPAGVAWQLVTEHGPLEVDGAGRIAGRRSTARVAARIARDAPAAVAARLNPLLDLIGRRGGTDEAIVDTGGRS